MCVQNIIYVNTVSKIGALSSILRSLEKWKFLTQSIVVEDGSSNFCIDETLDAMSQMTEISRAIIHGKKTRESVIMLLQVPISKKVSVLHSKTGHWIQ